MIKKLPNVEFRKLVPKLRRKGFYKSQIKRSINWHRYNLAQTEEATRLVNMINHLVDECHIERINILRRRGVDIKILAKVGSVRIEPNLNLKKIKV